MKRKKKTTGIVRTVKTPLWKRELNAFLKRAGEWIRNALMGAGLLAVMYVVMLAISRAMAGGG